MIDITYIVSCYDRPDMLACCLYSLKSQVHQNFEVIVTDNSTNGDMERVVDKIEDERFIYYHTKATCCYSSAELAVPWAKGKFLCFPSDDSYYVPMFGSLMMVAHELTNWELLYCDMLYGKIGTPFYCLFESEARFSKIDKTNFLLLKSKFKPFPGKIPAYHPGDGLLIDELVRDGIIHGRVEVPLVVHN